MSPTTSGGTPDDRVELLEQRLSRSRNFTVALTIALVASVLWSGTMNRRITHNSAAVQRMRDEASSAATKPVKDFIRAHQFEVVDTAGHVTAVLTTIKGAGAVVTRNAAGKRLVEIATTTDGQGMIVTRNGEERRVAAMGALASGEGFVTTTNTRGQELVRLGAVRGYGTVITKNAQGKELIHLGVSTSGDGLAYTTNGDGQRLVELGSTRDRLGGTIIVYNVTGGPIYSVKSDAQGMGVVRILDGNGNGQSFSALQFRPPTE